MAQRHERDFGFFVWTIPSFLLVFGFYTGFSIGMPIMAAGVILLFIMILRGPVWPADLGLIAGLGLGSLSFAAIAATSGGDYPVSPWLEIGLGLVSVSAAVFWWLRYRPGRASRPLR
jgi:hypothetical protein